MCAWWSRGPPECYSITKDQRMERRQTIGPKRATAWSPHGHLMVTSWSLGGDLPANASAVRPIQTRGLRLIMSHIWRPPAPYRFFLGSALEPYGGTRGKSHVYIPTEISDPKIVPSSPRVHPEFTPSSPAVHHWLCRWQGSEESNPELRFWRPLCCHYTRP